MSRSRIAAVTSHPIQYQAPWFRALARVVDLEVFFCHRQDAAGQAAAGFGVAFDWDLPLTEGYRHRWLTNVSPEPGVQSFGGCDTPGIADALAAGRYDACLVNGWYVKSFVQAMRASRKLGLPVLSRGDSHLDTKRSLAVRVAKYVPYRVLLRRWISAHLVVGRRNEEYLRAYGVPASRLFSAPHFVDNDRFHRGAEAARGDGSAAALRHAYGVAPEAIVFGFVGKFIDLKRGGDFISAIARLAQAGVPCAGLMVGAGPLEPAWRDLSRALGAPVHFLGFRNQSELPRVYTAMDALVLPSDNETWGLAVNEAMASGVPAIVSASVGCAPDLIEEGATGYTYPTGDVEALTEAMRTLAALPTGAREAMRRAVARHIGKYTCEAAVSGTLAAIEAVTRERTHAGAESVPC